MIVPTIRKQILFPDWLDANIKRRASRFGISYTDVVRAGICRSLIVHAQYLGYITDYFEKDKKDIIELFKIHTKKDKRVILRNHLDELMFECRKAEEWVHANIDKK